MCHGRQVSVEVCSTGPTPASSRCWTTLQTSVRAASWVRVHFKMAGVLKRCVFRANCGFCGKTLVLARLGLRAVSTKGRNETHFGYEAVTEEEKTKRGTCDTNTWSRTDRCDQFTPNLQISVWIHIHMCVPYKGPVHFQFSFILPTSESKKAEAFWFSPFAKWIWRNSCCISVLSLYWLLWHLNQNNT